MKSIFLTLFTITLTQSTPSCNDYCILDMGYPAGGELLGTSSCTASCNDCDEDCIEEDTESGCESGGIVCCCVGNAENIPFWEEEGEVVDRNPWDNQARKYREWKKREAEEQKREE